MDGVGEDLMSCSQVFPPALGGIEVFAGRGFLGQARDGIHKGLAISGRVVALLDGSGERSSTCRVESLRAAAEAREELEASREINEIFILTIP